MYCSVGGSFGMMIDISPKFYSVPPTTHVCNLQVKVIDLSFYISFVFSF